MKPFALCHYQLPLGCELLPPALLLLRVPIHPRGKENPIRPLRTMHFSEGYLVALEENISPSVVAQSGLTPSAALGGSDFGEGSESWGLLEKRLFNCSVVLE